MNWMQLSRPIKSAVLKMVAAMGYELIRISPKPDLVVSAAQKKQAEVAAPVENVQQDSAEDRSRNEQRDETEREELIKPYLLLYGREAVERRAFLNIGGGAFRHPCWKNVEFYSEHYKNDVVGNMDIEWDMSLGLPLPVEDQTIHLVYTSHTIEHTLTEHAQHMFSEAHRVLKPGGLLRIVCPNAELYYRAYLAGDVSFFPYPDIVAEYSLEQVYLHELATMLSSAEKRHGTIKLSDEYVRDVIHNNDMRTALDIICSHVDWSQNRDIPNHVSWWTYDKVFECLKKVGFSTFHRCGWLQSASPVLRQYRFFDTTWPNLSLFVEATKQ